ncbi:hypothetical protein [Bradyrhizobium sp. Leo121]|uniref:hypothetical protein n=1 Tax=Bradyrhizobium sp. Leo121 TaxID=1571195 RepID=UPI001029E93C|nr:hypothetical protein [Bradyrhizobium sp. Leo121]RZN34235.1 hypothetical protein CWO90_07325 [Bradyrhizobium sp. Leo121]
MRREDTAKLILISLALGVPPELHAAALDTADTADEKGMRGIDSDVFPKAFPDHLWTNDGARRKARARWLGADPRGYAAAYRMLVSAETRKELADVACPVLALAGKYVALEGERINLRIVSGTPLDAAGLPTFN